MKAPTATVEMLRAPWMPETARQVDPAKAIELKVARLLDLTAMLGEFADNMANRASDNSNYSMWSGLSTMAGQIYRDLQDILSIASDALPATEPPRRRRRSG